MKEDNKLLQQSESQPRNSSGKCPNKEEQLHATLTSDSSKSCTLGSFYFYRSLLCLILHMFAWSRLKAL